MKYYRCYFLTFDDHIASVRVLRCADDEDAKEQCRAAVSAIARCASAEIWDGARRLYRYPENPNALSLESRRRKGDASGQNGAIADALSDSIAEDRRSERETDAIKAAQLCEQRLERKAQDKTKAAPQGAKFIGFEEDDEIEYWTRKFGVTRERLAKAIGRVGPSAGAVERYLGGR
jgi:hypothetical protein